MEIDVSGKAFRIESIRIHDTYEGYLIGRREYLSKKIRQELDEQYAGLEKGWFIEDSQGDYLPAWTIRARVQSSASGDCEYCLEGCDLTFFTDAPEHTPSELVGPVLERIDWQDRAVQYDP